MRAIDGAGAGEMPRRLPPEDRRRHLIGVALELFAREGYSETDLSDIADAAGIRRTLLYHYFDGGKEDLYVAVLEHAWGTLASELTVDPGQARTVMPANLARFLDLVESGDDCVAIVRQSRRLDLPSVADTTRMASTVMARGMAANHLGLDKPPVAVIAVMQAFLSFFEGLVEEWTVGDLSREQVENVLVETLPGIAAAAQRAAAQGKAG